MFEKRIYDAQKKKKKKRKVLIKCSVPPRSVTKDDFSIARLEITEKFFLPRPFTLNKDFY
jgi:hypothetical protein